MQFKHMWKKKGFPLSVNLLDMVLDHQCMKNRMFPILVYREKDRELREGMVITIEPMVNVGKYLSKMDANGWTARTIDGKNSAQYEHTIAITKEGTLILTDQDNLD